jgi:MFS family permease
LNSELNSKQVSDIVPLKERGKYHGFVSGACSLGNAIGPFVGGGFASAGQWRWLFRVIAISGAIVTVAVHLIVPLKPVEGSITEKLKMIDYMGVLLSSSATIFLLIPISSSGSTFAWSSLVTISLLTLGVICLVTFVIAEVRLAKLPILPSRRLLVTFSFLPLY